MKNNQEIEKVCMKCKRIITDPKNKTGLCPKCKKTGIDMLSAFSAGALVVGAKKYAPQLGKLVAKIIMRKR